MSCRVSAVKIGLWQTDLAPGQSDNFVHRGCKSFLPGTDVSSRVAPQAATRRDVGCESSGRPVPSSYIRSDLGRITVSSRFSSFVTSLNKSCRVWHLDVPTRRDIAAAPSVPSCERRCYSDSLNCISFPPKECFDHRLSLKQMA